MKAAIDRAELLAALRWSAPVERDVPPPTNGKYSEGWTYNAYSMAVARGWSTSVSHGSGPAPTGQDRYTSGSQGARWMFSSEAKALAAMRHELENKAAVALLECDRRMREIGPNAEVSRARDQGAEA